MSLALLPRTAKSCILQMAVNSTTVHSCNLPLSIALNTALEEVEDVAWGLGSITRSEKEPLTLRATSRSTSQLTSSSSPIPTSYTSAMSHCSHWNWSYGLPHASVWPLELGLWTPTVWHGPSSWGYGLQRFNVAPINGVMDGCFFFLRCFFSGLWHQPENSHHKGGSGGCPPGSDKGHVHLVGSHKVPCPSGGVGRNLWGWVANSPIEGSRMEFLEFLITLIEDGEAHFALVTFLQYPAVVQPC